jgi:hypothetical protein
MNNVAVAHIVDGGIRELTMDEVNQVSGAGLKEAAAAVGLAGAIGATTWGGAAWGATAVGVAFAAAPIAVVAVCALAGIAGYMVVVRPPNKR